jgi:translation initiation factor IF-3
LYYDNKRIRINRFINVAQVRLIATDGTMIGVKPILEAQTMARSAGLDLVEIAPMANPPVCKIMDFSKYLYELDKQTRENRKKQKAGVMKEIRFNPRIAKHDLETKIRHIETFLKGQNKVRVTVVFHGRENQHRNLGEEILMNVKNTLAAVGVIEGRTQMMGNRMSIMLTPTAVAAAKNSASAKPPKPPKAPEAPKPQPPGKSSLS